MTRILALLALLASLAVAGAQTEITYWQYEYESRVEAMNQLIDLFEAENPDVTVTMETFPYDAYQQQVAASLPAGEGADVVQLFYGWLPTWQEAGYVEPLPEAYFDTEELDASFIPMVQAAKIDGEYYGLPTAVRSLALFYNADMLNEAGYDEPPSTWSEFIEVAQALTRKRGPRFERIGFGVSPAGQDHNLLREVLIRQMGGQPYSEDGSEVAYDSEEGLAAFDFYTDLITEHEVGVIEFVPGNNGYRDGFATLENIGMIVDGSFAIGTVRDNAQFEWGVAELPTFEDDGVRSNVGSFWMNGLTPNAFEDEATLDASARFLEFVTRPEAMELWLDVVGELPARASLVEDSELAQDPVYGPFIRSLAYAHATSFVDESEQRQIYLDAINEVVLEGADPADAWARAAEREQALLDAQ